MRSSGDPTIVFDPRGAFTSSSRIPGGTRKRVRPKECVFEVCFNTLEETPESGHQVFMSPSNSNKSQPHPVHDLEVTSNDRGDAIVTVQLAGQQYALDLPLLALSICVHSPLKTFNRRLERQFKERVKSLMEGFTREKALLLHNVIHNPLVVEAEKLQLNDGLYNFGNTCFLSSACQVLVPLLAPLIAASNRHYL